MNGKMLVIMCPLLFAVPALSFAQERAGAESGTPEQERADQKAKSGHKHDLFNYRMNKRIWDKRQAKDEAARKLKKAKEIRDKESGQIIIKF